MEGDALLGVAVDVDDCTLRMLAVGEDQDEGMAFGVGFLFDALDEENKIRMLGNVVRQWAARDLAAMPDGGDHGRADRPDPP